MHHLSHHLAVLCDRNKFFEPTEVATSIKMYGGTPQAGPKHVKASEKFRNCVPELPGGAVVISTHILCSLVRLGL
jgi:hypothetical protein